MKSAVLSAMPLRFARWTFSLLVFALIALLLPATARAQTTYTNTTGASFTAISPSSGVTSTILVSGAPGTVKTVQVELDGVKSDGQSFANGTYYDSLGYAEFLLKAPNGDSFVLLYATGDGIDGCDVNANADACDGLQGTLPTGTHPDTITIVDGAHYAPNGAGALTQQYEGWQTADMPYTVEPSSYGIDNQGTLPPLTASAGYPQTDGSQTLNGAFNGAPANGTWTLYLVDNDTGSPSADGVDPFSITGWKLTLTFNASTEASTTTALNSSANPATHANSAATATVTFTAIVTASTGTATGTVAFAANGSTISGCGAVALDDGQAQCISYLAQGNNAITATYSGVSGSFGASSNSMTELVEVTAANPSGDTWCNNSLVAVPANDNPGLAYPSVINIPSSAYSGKTVANVEVELEEVQGLSEGIGGQYLLVAPGGGSHNFLFFQQGFEDTSASSAVNLTFEDSAGATAPYDTGTPTSGTYLPTDNSNQVNPDTMPASTSPSVDSSIPQVPGTLNFAPPYGGDTTVYAHTNILTFGEAFNGATADGDWALYTVDPGAVNLNSGWCITLTLNTGTVTTTTVTSGQNPQATGQSVTITATVKAGGNAVTSGTVTFTDTTGATPVTLASNVALNSNGQASFSTSSLTEGDHEITANYSGVTNEDNASFGSMWQRINTATTASQVSSTEWQYCNPGAVQSFDGYPAGPFTPNPSVITVSNLPGTLNTVAVELTNFSVPVEENLDELASLVEGPTGAALDFFSNTTQGASGDSTASSGNYIFEDSAGSLVSSGNTNLTPGDYKPTAYESYLDIADTFTSSTSGQYPAPTSFSYAPNNPFGSSSTFADVFTNGSNANGTWSLFFNTTDGAQGTIGAANGWCVNLTENLPSVSIAASHSGNFTQGQQGVPLTVTVTNGGPGSTGDPSGSHPLTVTDTLPTGLSYANNYSGSGWSCSGSSTVTCTNDSAIGDGDQYPALTIDVNVATNAPTSATNSASASGGGASNTPSSNDSITIDPAPVLSVSKSHTGGFTQGSTAEWDITVNNTATGSTTSGAVTVSDTLPSGYTLSSYAGSGWSCSGTGAASVSCNSSSAISGGSSFPQIQLIVNVPANSPTSVSNTAQAWGGGDLTHTSSGTAVTSNTDSVTVVQVAASITVNGGGTQSATISTAFATPLSVLVEDAASNPINNASVTFTAPAAGASGTFSNSSNTITVNTNASGVASAGTFTANTTTGSYNVTAQVSGLGSSALFMLSNDQPPAFTSPSGTTFYSNVAGSFAVTTSPGFPGAATLAVSNIQNAVPGVNLPASGTGSITISGTPTATGIETFTVTATNGAGLTAQQDFTLTVTPPPSFVVTNNGDDITGTPANCPIPSSGTTCMLRDALAAASQAGAGSISFDSTVFASANSAAMNTITLSNGPLSLPSYTTVTGPTSGTGATLANLVTVNGGAAFRVFTTNASVAGAAIANLAITNGSDTSGTGAGIVNGYQASLTITNSTIYGNASTNGAGGIFNDYGASLSITGSTISGNSGAVGGIINELGGTVTVTSSTLSGNSASNGGGGIATGGGTVTVTDSTISGNYAVNGGGGIGSGGGTVNLANSIVDGNWLGSASTVNVYDDFDDTTGNTTYTGAGGNVLGYYNNPQAAAATPAVNLAPLGNNGGPTQTMLPLPGSPAICAGTEANAAAVSGDQRGFGFDPNCPAGSNTVDAGAVQTAYALAFNPEPPASVYVGAALSPAPAVSVTEAGGATVTSGTVSMTDADALLGGTTSVGVVAGTATFNNLVFSAATLSDTLTASLALNSSLAPPLNLTTPASSSFIVHHLTQTISFPQITGAQYALTSISLSATATSGLTVAFNSTTPSVCTVAGTTASLLTAGNCVIQANQAGDGAYTIAPQVSQYFAVLPVSQTINFPAITGYQVATTTLGLSATATSSLTVAFASLSPSVCTVSGATASLLTAGVCVIQATQAGGGAYAAAPAVQQNFAVHKETQVITFPAITGPQYALTQITLSASTTSNLPIVFSSGTPSVCTVSGNTASLLAVGNCVLRADQPDDATYAIGPEVSQYFAVLPAPQTITFPAITGYQVATTTLGLSATATSSLTVAFASTTPGVCTVAGTTASLLIAGVCNIQATQPGDGTHYAPAPPVSQSFSVHHQTQTISFPSVGSQTVGAHVTLTATASSGLTVSYNSTTTSVCSVSGSTATMLATGNCVIQASQAGNDAYSVAPQASQYFAVKAH
jgi:hypothetical protein